MTVTVTLKANDLKALVKAASKDATRPHLQGIRFWNGEMYCIDGHVLTKHPVDGLKDELNDYILHASDVKILPKHEELTLNLEDKALFNNTFQIRLQKTSHLSIEQLIPKTKPNGTDQSISFNIDLLYKAVKASPFLIGKKHPSVRIEILDNLSPIMGYVKDYQNQDYLAAIVMPVRW